MVRRLVRSCLWTLPRLPSVHHRPKERKTKYRFQTRSLRMNLIHPSARCIVIILDFNPKTSGHIESWPPLFLGVLLKILLSGGNFVWSEAFFLKCCFYIFVLPCNLSSGNRQFSLTFPSVIGRFVSDHRNLNLPPNHPHSFWMGHEIGYRKRCLTT